MWSFGIVVDDIPKNYSDNCESASLVHVPDLDLRLPLEMDGVISDIYTCYPSESKFENCTHAHLTKSVVGVSHLGSVSE